MSAHGKREFERASSVTCGDAEDAGSEYAMQAYGFGSQSMSRLRDKLS